MNCLPDDNGDGSMLCTEHPFKNNTPAGGICAFCLQEKLGKLVSSSFPIAVFPSSSSSSSSFRSETTTNITTNVSSSVIMPPHFTNTQINNTSNDLHYHQQHHQHQHYHSNGSRIMYLLGQKKKKKKENVNYNNTFVNNDDRSKNLVFKRSKSTATHAAYDDVLNSPHKSRFWSFLHLQKHNKTLTNISSNSLRAPSLSHQQNETNESNETPRTTSFGRKVSRSRSVGCGSRSFSGDFFERISTFGDCTLRRVESQREGKNKLSTINRCGGLFSGFMITSSSSSSSSSSNWIGSNHNEGNGSNVAGKVMSSEHSRSRSWGWVLASPMRGFSKPLSSSSSSSRKNEALKNKNQNPNLNAIPSLLSVS
ncbi:hypothetical protein QVD17_13284 [Tagetes erecta]|uniref:Uncharacterized protein n=1 Tax=Tagetes erecta TaxID=13708 RepID=A0AAD8KVQ2_TARER|nr:hypothetical protein QVD17_13284 [Tagetes erecta]